jgi:methionine sulfoxide reductase catalytic subunit
MRIRRKALLLLGSILGCVFVAAYVQWAVVGLPALPTNPTVSPETATEPYGFAAWLRITHYINLLFMALLVRSGLQILADHPRLYWNVYCTPGTEWARFTPIEVPKDRIWTAKDDSRYLLPWIGLPRGRHTIGMARHWHFLSMLFWVGNGVAYVVLLFLTPHWRRIVPTSWQIVPDAWAVFVHYATFHLPPEPNGFYHYNPCSSFRISPLCLSWHRLRS